MSCLSLEYKSSEKLIWVVVRLPLFHVYCYAVVHQSNGNGVIN